jgi:signal transduction histidine kinase
MTKDTPLSVLPYGIALLTVALATLLHILLLPVMPESLTLFFFVAVIASTWYGGFGPGLLSSVLSTVALDYFLIEPLYSVALSSANLIRLAIFLLSALFVSLLTNARKRAEEDLKKTLGRYNELLAREHEARDMAERANRMKDDFLATLSHELRTPLTAIIGWAEMLRRMQPGQPLVARAVEVIDRNAKSQAQLIEDLLDVSRIITGKLRLDLRPVELATTIDAAIDAMRPMAEAKGIQLEKQYGSLACEVSGDSTRLQQVVLNLLLNAIKFTPEGGKVEASVRQADSHAELTISDTGQGIAEEFLPHIFERFSQADSSRANRHGGLGLGLAIVRHLVELHGGEIQAHSAGPGQGSAFIIRLPLAAASKGAVHSDSASEIGEGYYYLCRT